MTTEQDKDTIALLSVLADAVCNSCAGEKWLYLGHPLERKCDNCDGSGFAPRTEMFRVKCVCACHVPACANDHTAYRCKDSCNGIRSLTLEEAKVVVWDILDTDVVNMVESVREDGTRYETTLHAVLAAYAVVVGVC